MAEFYLDSSALVKMYVQEAGSQWIEENISNPNTAIRWIARIGIVEAAAAIARRQRMGDITLDKRDLLYKTLFFDSRNRLSLLSESSEIISYAAELTQLHPLQGYDAVHLAAAIKLHQQYLSHKIAPIIFVSADETLCQAAKNEGLTIENPNEYP